MSIKEFHRLVIVNMQSKAFLFPKKWEVNYLIFPLLVASGGSCSPALCHMAPPKSIVSKLNVSYIIGVYLLIDL